VNPELPEAAVEFATAAARAFGGLGGVDCARSAELDPTVRTTSVAAALTALGADDLDPRADPESAYAAAELCRVAGREVLPYPVAGTLVRDPDGRPLALSASDRNRVDHGDLLGEWTIAEWKPGGLGDVGLVSRAGRASGPNLGSKLGPFVTPMDLGEELGRVSTRDISVLLALGASRILGVVERAIELATEHVCSREQFGQTLSRFQTVQFSMADAAVGRDGLRELCRYTIWRIFSAEGHGAVTDALCLRTNALDVARSVLRTTQQLHGASGLCDEYDISILCRHVQPELRLPFGVERTAEEAFSAVERFGFDSVFPHGAAPIRTATI
jgi:hypothetical protein